MSDVSSLVTLILLLGWISVFDITRRQIPLPALIWGGFWALLWRFAPLSSGQIPLADSLWGALVGGGALGLLYLLSRLGKAPGLGLGDLWLAAMGGAFLGWERTLLALAAAFIAGAVCALPLLLLRRIKKNDALPLAPFLSCGILAAYLWGEPFLLWYLG